MTGMDMLLASLTPEQLDERACEDAFHLTLADEEEAILAQYMRWLIEDLEKRIRE